MGNLKSVCFDREFLLSHDCQLYSKQEASYSSRGVLWIRESLDRGTLMVRYWIMRSEQSEADELKRVRVVKLFGSC